MNHSQNKPILKKFPNILSKAKKFQYSHLCGVSLFTVLWSNIRAEQKRHTVPPALLRSQLGTLQTNPKSSVQKAEGTLAKNVFKLVQFINTLSRNKSIGESAGGQSPQQQKFGHWKFLGLLPREAADVHDCNHAVMLSHVFANTLLNKRIGQKQGRLRSQTEQC